VSCNEQTIESYASVPNITPSEHSVRLGTIGYSSFKDETGLNVSVSSVNTTVDYSLNISQIKLKEACYYDFHN
jgi:hypothetical protein